MKPAFAVLALALFATHASAAEGVAPMDPAMETKLKSALAGPERTTGNKARDAYRHPLETLKFFGLKSGATVMEIWPGGGWWTEFLAPVVAQSGGTYIAASPDNNTAEGSGPLKVMAREHPDLYGKIKLAPFSDGKLKNVAPGSVDLVVTFRNIHNWMAEGVAKPMFDAMFVALKPGGYLGVEEHRAKGDKPQDPKADSGYVREDYAITLIEGSGFKLVAKSEINANPKDTKDYPKGVWTLPPTLLEKEKDRAKYTAIGESDRFTLLFQKPEK